ncbi:MAG: hypothetical protein IK104_03070 [Clostridia bacterium]|nr:hypothetical protein [Clostridia bacterium]
MLMTSYLCGALIGSFVCENNILNVWAGKGWSESARFIVCGILCVIAVFFLSVSPFGGIFLPFIPSVIAFQAAFTFTKLLTIEGYSGITLFLKKKFFPYLLISAAIYFYVHIGLSHSAEWTGILTGKNREVPSFKQFLLTTGVALVVVSVAGALYCALNV